MKISEFGDDLVFGNSCNINPENDFVFDIRLDLFDDKYSKKTSKIEKEEINNHYKNTIEYMIDFFSLCNPKQDEDCENAWSHDISYDKDLIIKRIRNKIKENENENINILGYDNYNYFMNKKFNNISNFCSFHNSIMEKCMEIVYNDSCAIEIGNNLINIINNKESIYRELCFNYESQRDDFINQIYDHNNKSIYGGNLSDIGIYWSWNPKTESYWGKEKGYKYCAVIKGQIENKEDIDIPNTYAINQAFNCAEKEIRLNPYNGIKIIDVKKSYS